MAHGLSGNGVPLGERVVGQELRHSLEDQFILDRVGSNVQYCTHVWVTLLYLRATATTVFGYVGLKSSLHSQRLVRLASLQTELPFCKIKHLLEYACRT